MSDFLSPSLSLSRWLFLLAFFVSSMMMLLRILQVSRLFRWRSWNDFRTSNIQCRRFAHSNFNLRVVIVRQLWSKDKVFIWNFHSKRSGNIDPLKTHRKLTEKAEEDKKKRVEVSRLLETTNNKSRVKKNYIKITRRIEKKAGLESGNNNDFMYTSFFFFCVSHFRMEKIPQSIWKRCAVQKVLVSAESFEKIKEKKEFYLKNKKKEKEKKIKISSPIFGKVQSKKKERRKNILSTKELCQGQKQKKKVFPRFNCESNSVRKITEKELL